MAYTKSDLARLRRARKVVNSRIAKLERAGQDDLPTITRLRAVLGGQSRIPRIQNGIYDDEFEALSKAIYGVYNDVYTSSPINAAEFIEGHNKMIKNLFKGIGRELTDDEVRAVKDFVPYDDFKDFLKNYLYEDVVGAADHFIKSGINYNDEYMADALGASVKDVFNEILKNEGIENHLQREIYVEQMYIGRTIQDVIAEANNDFLA